MLNKKKTSGEGLGPSLRAGLALPRWPRGARGEQHSVSCLWGGGLYAEGPTPVNTGA